MSTAVTHACTNSAALDDAPWFNAAMLRRIAWKDYRRIRGLWIMLFLMAVCSHLLGTNALSMVSLYGIVLVDVVLFGLGSGAIAFAVESEEETDGFLRALPVRSSQLFAAKVALILAAMIALAIMLTLWTLLYSWLLGPLDWFGPSDPGKLSALLGQFGLLPLEVLAWALLFSMLCKLTLVAACLGATGASLAVNVAARVAMPEVYLLEQPEAYAAAMFPYRWSLLAVVLAADVWLGRRWLRDLNVRSAKPRWFSRDASSKADKTAAVQRATSASSIRSLWYLIWHEQRMMRSTIGILWSINLLLAISATLMLSPSSHPEGIAALATLAIVNMMGASVFRADQQGNHFRYFHERPARPRIVWLSRQLTWLFAVGVTLSIGMLIWVGCGYSFADGRSSNNALANSAMFVAFAFLAYSSGQLSSMLFHSAILAGFAGLVLAAVTSGWTIFMYWLGVNWLLSTAPLPVIFLWVTWLRAPDWISERPGWRPQTRLGLSLVVPALALLTAVAAFRVFEVPRVLPGFSPEEYLASITPEARATGVLYERAVDRYLRFLYKRDAYRSAPKLLDGQWDDAHEYKYYLDDPDTRLKQNEPALRLVLEASARPECAFGPRGYADPRLLARVENLGQLLAMDAYRALRERDFDSALERYLSTLRMSVHLRQHQMYVHIGERLEAPALRRIVYWASLTGQTPERIRRAITELARYESTIPPPAQQVEAQYVWLQRVLDRDSRTLDDWSQTDGDIAREIGRYQLIARLMPWELYRTRRVVDRITATTISFDRDLVKRVAALEPTAGLRANLPRSSRRNGPTSWMPIYMEVYGNGGATFWLMSIERVRAAQLQLALIAWRLEHGQLPETLDELVGTFFEELPADPYSGENFRYFPHGLVLPKELIENRYSFASKTSRPFLWSMGSILRLKPGYDKNVFFDSTGKQLDIMAAIERGQAFEIPNTAPPDE